MNAFPRARTVFGFEYSISFHAELSDADRDIMGIEGLLFRNRLNGGKKIIPLLLICHYTKQPS